MTRSGSIGFVLFALAACGTPPPAPETPEQAVEAPEPPTPVAPSPPSIQRIDMAEPSHSLPEEAPAALAYLPASFEPGEPYDLVVFLHGWSGCVNVLMRGGEQPCIEGREARTGWNLGEILSAPQRVVLMPQLEFRRRDGDAGRFRDAEYVREWLGIALEALQLESPRSLVLMPHSAGFETALAWAQSGIAIDAIFLMDALYAKAPDFFEWAADDEARVLITFYTGGSTGRQSRRLARMAEREGLSERVRRVHTGARHAVVPSVEGPGALRDFFENAHRLPSVRAAD